MIETTTITFFLACFVALMAPILDYKYKKVPTWLTLPTLAVGIGIASAQGWRPEDARLITDVISQSSPSLQQTLITLAFVLAIFGPLTWKGGFAKEDLLLLLAIVSLKTFEESMSIIFYVVCVGFLMAIFVLLYKGLFKEGLKAVVRTAMFRAKKRTEDGKVAPIHRLTIPYSPAVACGVIIHVLAPKLFS